MSFFEELFREDECKLLKEYPFLVALHPIPEIRDKYVKQLPDEWKQLAMKAKQGFTEKDIANLPAKLKAFILKYFEKKKVHKITRRSASHILYTYWSRYLDDFKNLLRLPRVRYFLAFAKKADKYAHFYPVIIYDAIKTKKSKEFINKTLNIVRKHGIKELVHLKLLFYRYLLALAKHGYTRFQIGMVVATFMLIRQGRKYEFDAYMAVIYSPIINVEWPYAYVHFHKYVPVTINMETWRIENEHALIQGFIDAIIDEYATYLKSLGSSYAVALVAFPIAIFALITEEQYRYLPSRKLYEKIDQCLFKL